LILVEARYPQGVAAIAVTAGHERDRSYTFLFAAFFNDTGEEQVEIDRQPGERSTCHSRPMAGFHGASTRDRLCAGAATSP
jgi:hypothetical protein